MKVAGKPEDKGEGGWVYYFLKRFGLLFDFWNCVIKKAKVIQRKEGREGSGEEEKEEEKAFALKVFMI